MLEGLVREVDGTLGAPVLDMLRLDGISKRYGGVQALRDVSLRVEPGTVHCLMGENGSGKSTLIKIVGGAVRPDAGTIVVGDEVYPALNPRDAIRVGIDIIYQDLSLFANLTVAENLAIPAFLAQGRHRFSGGDSRRLAGQLLEQVGVALDLDALVGDLGSAQKQLTAICRALGHQARVIFMDEPTAALAWHEVETLFSLVRQLTAQGVAVVFVSHKLDEVLDISDHVTVLRNGQVVAQGPTSQFDQATLTQAMTGRSGWGKEEAQVIGTGLPQLEVRGLAGAAFADVSFAAMPSEIVGFAGLLGSGASELLESLFASPPPIGGEIRISGRKVQIHGPAEAMQEGIGYVPSDRLKDGLFIKRSIATNVVAASPGSVAGPAGFLRRAAIGAHGNEAIASLHIAAPSAESVSGELSGGNQQKVVLAKWLLRKPSVLLLNGPTVGVDVGAKAEIHRLLVALSKRGATILVASDDIPELAAICHRVFVMRRGQLVAELTAPDITEANLYQKMVA